MRAVKYHRNEISVQPTPKRSAGRIGLIYGRLTVIGYAGSSKWWCVCTCDETIAVSVAASSLSNGATQSCGCLHAQKTSESRSTHGATGTAEYSSWTHMLSRCYNSNSDAYHNYGGRGISVCPEWKSDFGQFLKDMGPCPPGYSLDRKDVNDDYCPSNCRWASRKTQANNTRTNLVFDGATLSELCGGSTDPSYERARGRLARGWCINCAVDAPAGVKCPHRHAAVNK